MQFGEVLDFSRKCWQLRILETQLRSFTPLSYSASLTQLGISCGHVRAVQVTLLFIIRLHLPFSAEKRPTWFSKDICHL